MKINLPKDKHIGILLEPRSGSHAFRNYVSSCLDYIDLVEMFNPIHRPMNLSIDKDKKILGCSLNSLEMANSEPKFKENLDESYLSQWADKYLIALNDMASIDYYAIFSIVIRNELHQYPEIIKRIKNNPNIYFIRLNRIDMLYGTLSMAISKYTKIWHNVEQKHTFSRVNMEKINLPLDGIENNLKLYVKTEKVIREIFGEVPVIYYEHWQNNIRNLNKIVNVPNKLVSLDYEKFAGNYKDLILNIDEIEDYYREFVNENSEYFQDDHVRNVLSNSKNEFH